MRSSSILKTEDEANDSGHSQNNTNWIQLQQLLLWTELGGFGCAPVVVENEYHGNDETIDWQIDVAKNESKTIRQPSKAHQYWSHFWLGAEGDYANGPYRYASSTHTSDGPTSNDGRFVLLDIIDQTANIEDQYRKDKGGLQEKVREWSIRCTYRADT